MIRGSKELRAPLAFLLRFPARGFRARNFDLEPLHEPLVLVVVQNGREHHLIEPAPGIKHETRDDKENERHDGLRNAVLGGDGNRHGRERQEREGG